MARHLANTRIVNLSPVSRREFLRRSGALIAGVSLNGLPNPARFAQDKADPIVKQVNRAIDQYMQDMQDQAPIGLAVAIVRPGTTPDQPVVNTFFRGEVQLGGKQLPDEKTIFELGSISKIFTASLLADMVFNQKLLKLEDDVQPYYDKLAPNSVALPTYHGKTIKFWHLATHTAGFPDDPPNLKAGGPCLYTTQLMYKALDALELPEAPGETASYSNLGFAILADVLMLISNGKSVEDVIQAFFNRAKLNLLDTHIMTADFSDSRFAQGYFTEKGSIKPKQANQCMPTWPAFDGAGALHSTLTDMIEWLKFNLQLLKSPLNNVPTEAIKPLHDFIKDEKIGLGWQLKPLKAKPGSYSVNKDGETLGFNTQIVFFPPTRTGAVALTNTAGSNPAMLNANLIEILNSN